MQSIITVVHIAPQYCLWSCSSCSLGLGFLFLMLDGSFCYAVSEDFRGLNFKQQMIVCRYRNESIYHKLSSEFLGVFLEFLRLKVKCYVFRLLLTEHQGVFIEEGFCIWSSSIWDLQFDTFKAFPILSGDVTCHWSSYDPMSFVIILALIVFFSLLFISSSFPFFFWFSFWISIPFMFMSYPASLLSFPVTSKLWHKSLVSWLMFDIGFYTLPGMTQISGDWYSVPCKLLSMFTEHVRVY